MCCDLQARACACTHTGTCCPPGVIIFIFSGKNDHLGRWRQSIHLPCGCRGDGLESFTLKGREGSGGDWLFLLESVWLGRPSVMSPSGQAFPESESVGFAACVASLEAPLAGGAIKGGGRGYTRQGGRSHVQSLNMSKANGDLYGESLSCSSRCSQA